MPQIALLQTGIKQPEYGKDGGRW